MVSRIVLLFFSVLSYSVWAQKIEYQIFTVDEVGRQTKLVEGVKEYSDSDFEILKGRENNSWSKSLELADGFGVGASIYRERMITGFGMWAQGSPCGFSWEWFKRSGPSSFIKLQESGEISVVFRHDKADGMSEIAEVRFDTDVSLRLSESKRDRETHRILIRKGSVITFPSYSRLQTAAAAQRPCV